MSKTNETTSKFESELSWLDSQNLEMQKLLTKICDINSGTFNPEGVNRVAHILKDEFKSICDEQQLVATKPCENIDTQGNVVQSPLGDALIMFRRPAAEQNIFLGIHTDTVYEKEHHFQKCQLLSETVLNGPGVADAKGGIVVMLFALRCLERAMGSSDSTKFPNPFGWQVILNPDEEIGSPSSVELFKEAAQRNLIGLIFEPAYPDGSMVHRRKGSGNFSIVFRGKSAHAGREFDKGRNAIVAAADAVAQLNQLNGQFDEVTFNIARMDGGGALNVVPELAIIRLNVRVRDSDQVAIVQRELDRIVEKSNQLDGISCELVGYFSSPPKINDEETKTIQDQIDLVAKGQGVSTSWVSTGGASDGNKLFAAGLPNIDTLGVIGGNIHSDQEYVDLENLVPRAKLVASLLMHYASGDLPIRS